MGKTRPDEIPRDNHRPAIDWAEVEIQLLALNLALGLNLGQAMNERVGELLEEDTPLDDEAAK